MMSSNSTLALANMGTEKINSDSSTDEVYIQYTGPTEMYLVTIPWQFV